METKSDDEGDPLPVKSACLIFLSLIFLAACHKPANTFQKVKKDKLVVAADSKTAYAVKRKSKKKKLYLTFDDGPNKGTRNVLHIVQDEAVPVSFFIVGQHVFASRFQHETWDSLQIAKHIDLCNHSFCHANNHYEKIL
jgi:peptidoglycan-N-acetylglucosamine deacetylase